MSFYNLHTIYANSGSNWELWSYQAEFGDAVEQHIVKLGKKKEKTQQQKNTRCFALMKTQMTASFYWEQDNITKLNSVSEKAGSFLFSWHMGRPNI